MKKYLFIIFGIYNLTISQNTINTDTIKELQEVILNYKATKLTPVTYQNISSLDIKNKSIGQEPSFILNSTPSVTMHSESGSLNGYSYFRLRGIQQEKVNITFNGVPMNDPVNQTFYFTNFPDLLNSISNIQIQRGVGTSKNGSSSYAGSIEISSPNLNSAPKKEFGIGYGSFNTLRAYGIYNSGIKNDKGLYIRLSKVYSNGFKQHSSNNSQSLFLSTGLFLEKINWKLNIIAGNSSNELAWYGELEDDIKNDKTVNANSIYDLDEFTQVTFQIQNDYYLNKKNTISSSIYYTLANGFWDDDYGKYYETIEPQIYRTSLNSHLFGLYANYHYKTKDALNHTIGVHANRYFNHVKDQLRIELISYDHQSDIKKNTQNKQEVSMFYKMDYRLNKILFFTDLQYRNTSFYYNGNTDFGVISWNFLNPKIGISIEKSSNSIIYFNVGKTSREPTMSDMFGGYFVLSNYLSDYGKTIDEIKTNPEHVLDYELGLRHTKNKLNMQLNCFYLDFNNQYVLDGNSSWGSYIPSSTSIKKSIRSGLELYLEYKINNNFKIINNSSYNYSSIINDEGSSEVKAILTPPLIINQEFIYTKKNFGISVNCRYQDASYIDLNNEFSIEKYFFISTRMDFKLKQYSASIFINNITNSAHFNYAIRDDWDTRRYFIQAPRSIYLSIKYNF